MGKYKRRQIQQALVIEQQIEIDRPRAPSFGALPSQLLFDALQRRQDFQRLLISIEPHGRVREVGLADGAADRMRLLDVADC
jgi:hypothetical protein